jgi:arylsulfatase A-like enzyme
MRMPKKKFLILLAAIALIIPLLLIIIPGSKPEAPKNVVFILVDAMRADHLGCYGYKRNTSPVMDSLAESGVLFENCFSQSGWTCPSVCSYFTSMYPDFHKSVIWEKKLNPRLMKISKLMKSAGYFTAGASANVGISKKSGFADGFDSWIEGLDDIRLTRWAQSFLEKDDINFDQIRKYNLIKDGSFQNEKTFGAVKNFGTVIPGIPGYIDYTCLRLRMRHLLNNKPVTIVDGIRVDKSGEYAWGIAVRTEKMTEPLTIELNAVKDNKDLFTIDSRKIPAGENWNLYKFRTQIKAGTEVRVNISAPFEWVQYPDKSFKQIFIDEIFLFPQIESIKKKPHYLYLHYMAPHAPHTVQEEAKTQFYLKFTNSLLPHKSIINDRGDPTGMNDHKFILQAKHALDWAEQSDDINWNNNRYDEEILFADSEIEKIVNLLKKTGEFDNTLLIITADHGEEFMDHGFISHSQSLYNELLHIPFILIYPDGWSGNSRITEMIESVDLMPTLLDLIKTPKSAAALTQRQMSGRSLLPLIRGKKGAGDRISYSSDFVSKQWAAISGGYKYILKENSCFTRELLFNIKNDFLESRDLSREDTEHLNDFRLIIKSYRDRAAKIKDFTEDNSDFNSEQMRMIRGLGYITRNDVILRGLDADCFLIWFRFICSHIYRFF